MARPRAPRPEAPPLGDKDAPWRRHLSDELAEGAHLHACDWPGCRATGEYSAPKSRDRLEERYLFCQEHAREYNQTWNYYAGMTEDEVEADRRHDTVWNRPSWPFGTINPGGRGWRVRDDFGVYEETVDGTDGATPRDPHRHTAPKAGSPEERAMSILDLTPPLSVEAIKARYKALVKRHHPDANGGDKAAEEKFKQIGEAYRILMAAAG